MRIDPTYVPRLTWSERAYFATRAELRTARMRWRQFRAALSPSGWLYVILAGIAVGACGAWAFVR